MSGTSRWAIAIHGGAGGMPSQSGLQSVDAKIEGLREILAKGAELLQRNVDAIDVVQTVVEMFEDNPAFNAGRGSVLDARGEVSLDASLMDGRDLSCGAVSNVTRPKNPIRLARAVRDRTSHVLLTGSQADEFAVHAELPLETQDYFRIDDQVERWKRWKAREERRAANEPTSNGGQNVDPLFHLSTVGCVALDVGGNLAAATSTGGLLGKKFGRVGDSPIIGAGTYAKNGNCAVSCTGVGELFIKNYVAASVSARVALLNEPLHDAVRELVNNVLPSDSGGIIAVDAHGNLELQFNTPMMARGRAHSDGTFQIGITDWLEPGS